MCLSSSARSPPRTKAGPATRDWAHAQGENAIGVGVPKCHGSWNPQPTVGRGRRLVEGEGETSTMDDNGSHEGLGGFAGRMMPPLVRVLAGCYRRGYAKMSRVVKSSMHCWGRWRKSGAGEGNHGSYALEAAGIGSYGGLGGFARRMVSPSRDLCWQDWCFGSPCPRAPPMFPPISPSRPLPSPVVSTRHYRGTRAIRRARSTGH